MFFSTETKKKFRGLPVTKKRTWVMPRDFDARLHAGTPGYQIGLVKKSWKHYKALSSQQERTDYIDELSWMVDEMMEKNDKHVDRKNKYVDESASESDGEQSDKEEMLEELQELKEEIGQSSDKVVCGKLHELSMDTKIKATTQTPEVAMKRTRELEPLASFRPFIPGSQDMMQWNTVQCSSKKPKKLHMYFV